MKIFNRDDLIELLRRAAEKAAEPDLEIYRAIDDLSDNVVVFFWRIDDVLSVRPDLSDDEAMEVLLACYEEHDANYGMNWQFIEHIANDMFPKDRGE